MDDAAGLLPGAPGHALVEALAELAECPMPPGWWMAEAVQERQDCLAAVANLTVAAFAAILPYRGTPKWDAALRLFSDEMVALDDAMRAYTCMTQRDDVLGVVRHALAAAGGAALADLLVRMLRRVRGD